MHVARSRCKEEASRLWGYYLRRDFAARRFGAVLALRAVFLPAAVLDFLAEDFLATFFAALADDLRAAFFAGFLADFLAALLATRFRRLRGWTTGAISRGSATSPSVAIGT
jgi:hypothetical protein